MKHCFGLIGIMIVATVSYGSQTILFTNDTHAHIDDGNITFSQIAAYRAALEEKGAEPILVDCGDVVQGTAFAKIDNAVPLVEILNAAGYQAATLGNHEFDYGLPASVERAKKTCRFPVVACNFWKTNLVTKTCDQLLAPYTVVTTATARVAFVGVVTPESITSSTPMNFMDETGSYYLYGFNGGMDGKDLFKHVQDAVNAAAKEADAVIVLSHLGLGKGAGPWASTDLIANTTNFVALLDGHSHSFANEEVLNAAGQKVRLCQSGCHLKTLGELTLSGGKVERTQFHKKLGEKDQKVAALEAALAARVEAWLGEKLGVADDDLYRYLPRRGACGETGLGDFVADAYYWYANTYAAGGCDIAVNNYSGIRSNVKKGDFKLRTANDVCPFGNGVCLIEATGRELREALEWGARAYPDYEGGFFHAAGFKYKVATQIPSTVQSKEGIWTGGPKDGVYRVCEIEVYDRAAKKFLPLDLEKTYRVAGCDYVLLNGGNGFHMLTKCKVIDPCLKTDYLALSEYVKAFKKGEDGVPHINSAASPLAELPGYPIDYASRYGANRIAPFKTPAEKAKTKLLEELIAIPSVSGDIPQVNRAQRHMQAWLEARGIVCVRETMPDGHEIVFASTQPGKVQDFILSVHLDVVPAEASLFCPKEKGDWLFGRGAHDCKGTCVAAAQALVRLKGKASVGIIFGADEEIGGLTTRWMVEQGYRPRKMAIVVDSRWNAITYAQKGNTYFTVSAHGESGHSALPWEVQDSIAVISSAYLKLREAWDRQHPISNDHWCDTLSATVLKADGGALNCIPGEASFVVNLRSIDASSADRTEKFIREITGLKVSRGEDSKPFSADANNPLIARLRAKMQQWYPGEEIPLIRSVAATDARCFYDCATPVVAIGANGSGDHAADEKVSLSGIDTVTNLLVDFISAER